MNHPASPQEIRLKFRWGQGPAGAGSLCPRQESAGFAQGTTQNFAESCCSWSVDGSGELPCWA